MGVAVSRGVDLIVTLLGVLKAGAAYVPLDPGFPAQRLRHMAEDSGATIVVTDAASASRLPETYVRLLVLGTEGFGDEPAEPPDVPFEAESLAYLEYLGRLDSQVKVRGHRIELGEIEAVLGRDPRVRQAVVLARRDDAAEARLVAYIVPQDADGIDIASVREIVAAALPPYMVPSNVVPLDRLPLTPNGKVDRRALPASAASRDALGREFTPPQTELQQRLAVLWQQLLHIDRVGIDDPFAELGGHSLLLVRMQARLRRELAEIPLAALYEHPTIRTLALFIERFIEGQDGSQGDGRLARVLARAQERRHRGGAAGRGTGRQAPRPDHAEGRTTP